MPRRAAAPDPGLSADPWPLLRPLLFTMLLPLAAGMVVKNRSRAVGGAASVASFGPVSNVSMLVAVVLLFGLNFAAHARHVRQRGGGRGRRVRVAHRSRPVRPRRPGTGDAVGPRPGNGAAERRGGAPDRHAELSPTPGGRRCFSSRHSRGWPSCFWPRQFARPSLTPSSVGDDFASERAAPLVDATKGNRMIREDIIDLFRVPPGKKVSSRTTTRAGSRRGVRGLRQGRAQGAGQGDPRTEPGGPRRGPGPALRRRPVRRADRAPGDGRGRQGRHDQARHVRRQPAGLPGLQLQEAVGRGARPQLPLALHASACRSAAGSASSTGRTTRTCWW